MVVSLRAWGSGVSGFWGFIVFGVWDSRFGFSVSGILILKLCRNAEGLGFRVEAPNVGALNVKAGLGCSVVSLRDIIRGQ